MPDEIILTDLKDGVLTITLNRPKANAFTTEMAQALTKVLRDAGLVETTRRGRWVHYSLAPDASDRLRQALPIA